MYFNKYLNRAIYDWLHYFRGEWEGWALVNRCNHTSWVNAVTPTDRPKWVRNRCLLCMGVCHRTESDLFFFVFGILNAFLASSCIFVHIRKFLRWRCFHSYFSYKHVLFMGQRDPDPRKIDLILYWNLPIEIVYQNAYITQLERLNYGTITTFLKKVSAYRCEIT